MGVAEKAGEGISVALGLALAGLSAQNALDVPRPVGAGVGQYGAGIVGETRRIAYLILAPAVQYVG